MVPHPTDSQLISASAEDPPLFGTIFERHFDRIFSYIARRLGEDKASDIAAETFTIAFRRRGDYDRSRADALPWLYGIAVRLIRKHRVTEFRRSRALQRSAAAMSREVQGQHDIDARLDAERVLPQVAAAVSKLSADDRETLLLIAWAGLSYQEVAFATDVPIGTVRSRLNRVRTRLQAALPGLAPELSIVHVPTEEANHG